jgi:hypothetical protein
MGKVLNLIAALSEPGYLEYEDFEELLVGGLTSFVDIAILRDSSHTRALRTRSKHTAGRWSQIQVLLPPFAGVPAIAGLLTSKASFHGPSLIYKRSHPQYCLCLRALLSKWLAFQIIDSGDGGAKITYRCAELERPSFPTISHLVHDGFVICARLKIMPGIT